MRVIAGSARRLQLKTPDGLDTRPTTDRIKETLFNMLAPSLYGCVFLDLFSGSGGIGIEALSRGAKEAVFVERNPKAASCIKKNLKYTKLWDRSVVLAQDVMAALRRLEGEKEFDFIFMDPPYGQGLERKALEYLAGSAMVHDNTAVIVEASKETDFSYLEGLGFRPCREKIYKSNKHVFLEKARKEER